MTDTAALVGEAKELLAKATPGPWEFNGSSERDPCCQLYATSEWVDEYEADILSTDGCHELLISDENKALIARAPTLIAQLCDEVERLREELVRAKQDRNSASKRATLLADKKDAAEAEVAELRAENERLRWCACGDPANRHINHRLGTCYAFQGTTRVDQPPKAAATSLREGEPE